ncbi:MAG: hypothetical protein ACXWWL_07935 [Candidatus Limnocylindria bacterium]
MPRRRPPGDEPHGRAPRARQATRRIGRAIDVPVPARVDALVAEGALRRKSGRGLYSYDK